MSGNFGSPLPEKPLSVGNVVSAGFRLYRSHLKDYFLLALEAYVWLLVPIYGWTKFYTLSALISRLAFGELVNQPESITSGKRFVNSRFGQFFANLLLMFLISIGLGVVLALLSLILVGLFGGISIALGQQQNAGMMFILGLLMIVVIIVFFAVFLWLMTRFYLVDIPLAIEDNIDGSSTISRSWELTKGNVLRIFSISFIPLFYCHYILPFPFQIVVFRYLSFH